MNAPFKQAERLGRLTTELGQDDLALLRFDGSDHLNELFEYRVEALAIRDDLDFDALVGTHATVEIEAHEVMRPFDGIVTSARWAGVGENGHRYDLTLRPWFWLAGRRRNQRIFHEKTVIEILQELLSDYAGLGDPALEISLSKDYPTLEYTVQYRESDLDFARRQMERHGISFHFKHAMGSHTLVLTDDALAHEEIGARPFKRYDGHHQYEQEHFWDWAPERNVTTGAIRLVDYNFKKPTQAMEVDRLGDAAHAQGQIESFDYPGDYLAQDVGKLVACLRTEQERGADRRNRAVGDCVSLTAGKRVTLSGDKVPGLGDVPVLGNLFKSTSRQRGRTNLMVFIRPTIIRTPGDAQQLSADRWGYMRGEQIRSQPGVEPSLDEMLRDYMRTQAPVAPRAIDNPAPGGTAPVGEVTISPLAPAANAAPPQG